MPEYVCLKCFNVWISRTRNGPRVLRCTNLECHSRNVALLDEFEECIKRAAKIIQGGGRLREAVIHCRGLKVRSGIPIFPLPDSLDFWINIYDIASAYKGDIRGAIEKIKRASY